MTPRDHDPKLPPEEDDFDAPPTEEELAESARLRDALEGRGAHPDAELAEALRHAIDPAPPSAEAIDLALHRAGLPVERRSDPREEARPAGGNVIRIAFGATAFLAAAAAAVLFLRVSKPASEIASGAASASVSTMVASRSTQDLFPDPFPREGGGSARIDRIATARARDLRQNRYASWGVR
jgi:hypothetical protein